MYYISDEQSNLGLSHIKKRLRDFKGIEGETYIVRHGRSVDRFGAKNLLFSLPQYIFKDGKLRKTGNYSVYISSLG